MNKKLVFGMALSLVFASGFFFDAQAGCGLPWCLSCASAKDTDRDRNVDRPKDRDRNADSPKDKDRAGAPNFVFPPYGLQGDWRGQH